MSLLTPIGKTFRRAFRRLFSQAPSSVSPDQERSWMERQFAYYSVGQPWAGPLSIVNGNLTGETWEMRQAYREWAFREPAAKAALQTKCFAVAQLDLQVHPSDPSNADDKRAAEWVKHSIQSAPGGSAGLVANILLPGLIDGFSVNEKLYGKCSPRDNRYPDWWTFKGTAQIDTQHVRFRLDPYRQVVGIQATQGVQTATWNLPPEDYLIYTHLKLFENPFGFSDLRAAVRACRLIESAIRLRHILLTNYSGPFLKARAGDPAARASLMNIMEDVKANGWVVVPDGTEIEVMSLTVANLETFNKAIEDYRQEIVQAIQGAYLQLLEGGIQDGRGNTQVHKSISEIFQWWLAVTVGETINAGLVPDLVIPNFGHSVGFPRVELGGIDEASMASALQRFKAGQDLGLELSKAQVRQVGGFEMPTGDDDILPPPAGGPKGPDDQGGDGGPGGGGDNPFAGMFSDHSPGNSPDFPLKRPRGHFGDVSQFAATGDPFVLYDGDTDTFAEWHPYTNKSTGKSGWISSGGLVRYQDPRSGPTGAAEGAKTQASRAEAAQAVAKAIQNPERVQEEHLPALMEHMKTLDKPTLQGIVKSLSAKVGGTKAQLADRVVASIRAAQAGQDREGDALRKMPEPGAGKKASPEEQTLRGMLDAGEFDNGKIAKQLQTILDRDGADAVRDVAERMGVKGVRTKPVKEAVHGIKDLLADNEARSKGLEPAAVSTKPGQAGQDRQGDALRKMPEKPAETPSEPAASNAHVGKIGESPGTSAAPPQEVSTGDALSAAAKEGVAPAAQARAQQYLASLGDPPPPPEPGTVRLYRGTIAGQVPHASTFWSDERGLAGVAIPFAKAPGRNLVYVDVPESAAAAGLLGGAVTDGEYQIPEEFRKQIKPWGSNAEAATPLAPAKQIDIGGGAASPSARAARAAKGGPAPNAHVGKIGESPGAKSAPEHAADLLAHARANPEVGGVHDLHDLRAKFPNLSDGQFKAAFEHLLDTRQVRGYGDKSADALTPEQAKYTPTTGGSSGASGDVVRAMDVFSLPKTPAPNAHVGISGESPGVPLTSPAPAANLPETPTQGGKAVDATKTGNPAAADPLKTTTTDAISHENRKLVEAVTGAVGYGDPRTDWKTIKPGEIRVGAKGGIEVLRRPRGAKLTAKPVWGPMDATEERNLRSKLGVPSSYNPSAHEDSVKAALLAGKTVPDSVVAGFPELATHRDAQRELSSGPLKRRKDFMDRYRHLGGDKPYEANLMYAAAVENAVAAGKKVSPEVMADYKELKAKISENEQFQPGSLAPPAPAPAPEPTPKAKATRGKKAEAAPTPAFPAGGYGAAGAGHPLAGLDREGQIKALAAAIGKADREDDNDPMGYAAAGPPANHATAAPAIRDAVNRMAGDYSVSLDKLYNEVGPKTGQSKNDFIRSLTAMYHDDQLSLGSTPRGIAELEHPDLAPVVSARVMISASPGSKDVPPAPAAKPIDINDPKALADAAHQAAVQEPNWTGAPHDPNDPTAHKVLLSQVYDRLKPQLPPGTTLDQFKGAMQQANAAGHAELSRVDLPHRVPDELRPHLGRSAVPAYPGAQASGILDSVKVPGKPTTAQPAGPTSEYAKLKAKAAAQKPAPKTTARTPHAEAVMNAHENATGKGKDLLGIAIHNAGGDAEKGKAPKGTPADLAQNLAATWMDAHRSGAGPADLKPIEDALHAIGAKPVGTAGQTLPLDPRRHQADEGVSTGSPVTVARPGWSYHHPDGRELLLTPAKVSRNAAGSVADRVKAAAAKSAADPHALTDADVKSLMNDVKTLPPAQQHKLAEELTGAKGRSALDSQIRIRAHIDGIRQVLNSQNV